MDVTAHLHDAARGQTPHGVASLDGSILMTSAPQSARMAEAAGTKVCSATSRMRTPFMMSIISLSSCDLGVEVRARCGHDHARIVSDASRTNGADGSTAGLHPSGPPFGGRLEQGKKIRKEAEHIVEMGAGAGADELGAHLAAQFAERAAGEAVRAGDRRRALDPGENPGFGVRPPMWRTPSSSQPSTRYSWSTVSVPCSSQIGIAEVRVERPNPKGRPPSAQGRAGDVGGWRRRPGVPSRARPESRRCLRGSARPVPWGSGRCRGRETPPGCWPIPPIRRTCPPRPRMC